MSRYDNLHGDEDILFWEEMERQDMYFDTQMDEFDNYNDEVSNDGLE